jgi:predicted methyltransferase
MISTLLRHLAPVPLLLGATGALAESPGADPQINAPFRQPDPARWVEAWERPGRELYDRREAVMSALGLRPGTRVADVGAGTGLYTELFARATGPEGLVYAVDVSADFVRAIERRAQVQGLRNVRGIVNTQRSALLPAASVDLAFLADAYHHFEHPADMLRSIHAALVPAGELVIVDFRRDPAVASPWVMQHVRAGSDQVVREVELAGFRFVGEEPILRGNFFLRFRKP